MSMCLYLPWGINNNNNNNNNNNSKTVIADATCFSILSKDTLTSNSKELGIKPLTWGSYDWSTHCATATTGTNQKTHLLFYITVLTLKTQTTVYVMIHTIWVMYWILCDNSGKSKINQST